MATLVAGAGGCAPGPEGEGPVLDPVDDQQAYVGSPCTIALRASDPDHDALSFSFSV